MGDNCKSMLHMICHAGYSGLYKFHDLCVVKSTSLVYLSGIIVSLVELLIKNEYLLAVICCGLLSLTISPT